MRRRYLECEDEMGAGESPVLSEFLALYRKEGGKKKVTVRGVGSEGHSVSHDYKLHERHLEGHVLNFRLSDLKKLAPTKLFRASKWPKQRQQHDRKVREYLHGCSALFGDKLPGFNMIAAERELLSWVPIMETHHEDEGFFQGLCNFMNTSEANRKLMAILLLDYDINWDAALAKWREKPRRPAKTPVFAAVERKRKGKDLDPDEAKQKEVEAGDWGEEDDSDFDGGEDGFAEARHYDATDNPFLSEDEGEEDDEGDEGIEMAVPE
ncbi:unnamed protein product [Closterium sp. Naga37s-1]|nr:unnamed protein product [Closterium sp. Naga37s-1]